MSNSGFSQRPLRIESYAAIFALILSVAALVFTGIVWAESKRAAQKNVELQAAHDVGDAIVPTAVSFENFNERLEKIEKKIAALETLAVDQQTLNADQKTWNENFKNGFRDIEAAFKTLVEAKKGRAEPEKNSAAGVSDENMK